MTVMRSPAYRGFRRWRLTATVGVAALVAAMTGAFGTPAGATPPGAGGVRLCPPATARTMTCDSLRHVGATGSVVPLDGPAGGYAPADLSAAYHLATGGGAGRTVAIVDAFDDPTAESDLGVYRAQFGLPACTTANGCFRKVNAAGAASPLPVADPGWDGEIALDTDMVSAICPNCHILLVEADSPANEDLYGAEDFATATATFVSNSWGGPESSAETTSDSHFNRPGDVITFSTGDDGHGVQYPAASQYVVAVGGTTLTRGAAGQFTESAWSGAGSGCSAYEPQLGWQVGPPDTGCPRRAVADVSAVADPNTGVAVYDTSGDLGWTVLGGTSAASPIIAAVYALAGPPPAGDPASFYLYRHLIGRGPTVVPAEQVLNDPTSGSNGDCGVPTCGARTGWDGPTGVGTPIGTGAFARPYAFGAIITGTQSTPVHGIGDVTLRGTDGTAPYTWAATGLPPGLTLNAATGEISGSPFQDGTFQVTVTGHDATGSPPGTYSFTWVITTPATVVVPDVIDDSAGSAVSILTGADLLVSQSSTVDCNHLGTVRSESPAGGTEVLRGSTVRIVVGTAPAPPRVCP
jgi:hypothetical protein